ncbi:MAG: spondin domain-containing protein [Actinomycetota bacterium]
MRKHRSAWSVAVAMLLTSVLVATVGAGAANADSGNRPQVSYTVTVKNITSGQYLTPPNVAAHTRDVDVFQRNQPASPGVQAVAENGGVGVLEAELAAAVDAAGFGVSGVGSPGAMGPLAPGEESTFTFTTDADRISIVSMVVCTNDGFAGVDSRPLPTRDGQTRTFRAQAYDAGTEINTEMRADLVPAPFCGPGEGSGMSNPALAENGKIRRHLTLRGVGDLDPSLDWRGAVAEVTVVRNPSPATYHVVIENLTDGQYLTPPNYAFHDRSVRVFRPGRAASPGVQAVAENGGTGVLEAELMAAIDDNGLGDSGLAPGGAMGPVAPGEVVEFTVTSAADRLSIVSMVICTNDGFAGLNSKSLPRWPGDSRTFNVRAYDAGTEINTEMREDLVPAPFCGPEGGTGMSNPELAENSVIRPHRTLLGVGDLDPSLDWQGPVMRVTITRVENAG